MTEPVLRAAVGDVVMGVFINEREALRYASTLDIVLSASMIRGGLPMPYADVQILEGGAAIVLSPRMALVTPEVAISMYDCYIAGRASASDGE